jgi:uncharacterized pyridoxamine 5'-phosphate oxidase family protein
MELYKTLDFLTNEIHSVVVATVDENLNPVTRVIDIMLYDENSFYFLTAKGKSFYEQLMKTNYISLSGLTEGKNSMEKKSITISGQVENIGNRKLDEIFEKNSYMKDIYPNVESRMALGVFRFYKGQGEYFDLSTKPITRERFSLGSTELKAKGYFITKACIECGECIVKCPQKCIVKGTPYYIEEKHCLHCGNCYEICKHKAIVKR